MVVYAKAKSFGQSDLWTVMGGGGALTSERNLVISYTTLSTTTQHELWSQWCDTSCIEYNFSEISTAHSPETEPCGEGVSRDWYAGITVINKK